MSRDYFRNRIDTGSIKQFPVGPAYDLSIKLVGRASFIGANYPSVTLSLTSLTGGLSSTAIAGDIVLVIAGEINNTTSPTVNTSGYSKVVNVGSSDTNSSSLSVSWKVMGSTPDTSVNVSNNSSQGAGIQVLVYRDINATQLDVSSTTATGQNGNQVNLADITPATAGSLIIACGVTALNTRYISFSGGPSGYSNFINLAVDITTYGGSVGTATKVWTSGTDSGGTFTTTTSGSGGSWCGAKVVIRHL
jgi:hypothetical protein